MTSSSEAQQTPSSEEQRERRAAAHRYLLRRDLVLHVLLVLAVTAGICALFDSWQQAPIFFIAGFAPLLMKDLRLAREASAES